MNKKVKYRLLLLAVCFLCIGIYYNCIEVSANIKVKVENNKITSAEGSGVLTIGKNIQQVYLDSSIRKGDVDITRFKVASGNKYFTVADDVLFNKDKTELLYYPNAKKGSLYIVKKTVNTIKQCAFAYNKYLENITIKNGVKNIGFNAFKYSNIKSVTIPGSVSEIGSGVFGGCKKLENVECNADISSIPPEMFYGCSALKTFKIPESVTEIMEFAFMGCVELDVKIGKNISRISNIDAFYNAAVSFEVDKNNGFYKSINGVLYSKDGTKLECYPYKKTGGYVMPDEVMEINYGIFLDNTSITGITLGNNIKEFDMYSLYGCTSLERLVFPAGIENIIAGNRELPRSGYGLKSLKEIYVPESNTNYKIYEGCLYSAGYKKLYFVPASCDTLVINGNTEEIADGIVCQNNFKEIKIPDSNQYYTVKDNVLYDKAITKIIIFPSKLKTYNIPATVKDVSVILNDFCTDEEDEGFAKYDNMAYNLESITADAGNNYFRAEDGVLYNKDMTELVLYPQKRGGTYTMPGSVTTFNPAVFTYAGELEGLTVTCNELLVLNGCASLKKLSYSEGVTVASVYGDWFNRGDGVQLSKLYLPGSIKTLAFSGDIGKNTTVYAYNNTGEYGGKYGYDKTPVKDVKTYIKELGYKYKSLGTAPGIVKNGKAVISGSNIKVSWKALPEAEGYRISYFPDAGNIYNEIVLKNISGGKKGSCNIKKSRLGRKKKIYIRAYKNINGIKIYGKPAEVSI
ncbi:MAG: leucine-rich repeat protein [Lachnospiraceae bacterium]|nr:leucine-rich repeat protein [Lachnospiraceae bacterium]